MTRVGNPRLGDDFCRNKNASCPSDKKGLSRLREICDIWKVRVSFSKYQPFIFARGFPLSEGQPAFRVSARNGHSDVGCRPASSNRAGFVCPCYKPGGFVAPRHSRFPNPARFVGPRHSRQRKLQPALQTRRRFQPASTTPASQIQRICRLRHSPAK